MTIYLSGEMKVYKDSIGEMWCKITQRFW